MNQAVAQQRSIETGTNRLDELKEFLDSNITNQALFIIEKMVLGRIGAAPAGKINLILDIGEVLTINARLVAAYSLIRLPASGGMVNGAGHALVDFWRRNSEEEVRLLYRSSCRAKIHGRDEKFAHLELQPGIEVAIALDRIKSFELMP